MPINIDRVKELRLIKTQFYTPFNKKDKRHGSAIFLMATNIDESLNIMNNKTPMQNLNMYYSYYIEPDIKVIINNDKTITNESGDLLDTGLWLTPVLEGKPMYNENYIQDTNSITFLCEDVEELLNNKMKKIFYNQRIKTNAELNSYYSYINSNWENKLKYRYNSLDKYKNRNVFIDSFLYNNILFRYLQNNSLQKTTAMDIMFNLFDRLVNNTKIDSYTRKTVIIPVNDWCKGLTPNEFFNTSTITNPINMIYRLAKSNIGDKLSKLYGIDFVFLNVLGWFKVRLENLNSKTLPRFKDNIIKLHNKEFIEDNQRENNEEIAVKVIDNIEIKTGIEVNNLSGEKNETININKTEEDKDKPKDKIEKDNTDAEIYRQVRATVNDSSSEEDNNDAIDKNDHLKIAILQAKDLQDDTFKISAARRARLDELDNRFLQEKVRGKKIEDLINIKEVQLEKTSIEKVESFDNEWKNLTKPNFEKDYDIDADIYKCLKSLSDKDKDIQMSIVDISAEDTSTSEDAIITYRVKLEDSLGKRHSIVFDMPKILHNRFLKLRGNDKVVPGQLINLPIIKTDDDTVQLVTNYNKIIITRYGQAGRSTAKSDALLKTINKIVEMKYPKNSDGTKTIHKVIYGNNSKICAKYDLPIEYTDMAKFISKIELDDSIIYFNQDEIREIIKNKNLKYESTSGYSFPIGFYKDDGSPIIMNSNNFGIQLYHMIVKTENSNSIFKEIYDKYNKSGRRLMYSQASILNTKMPLIVVMAYTDGLTKALDKAKVQYTLKESRPEKGYLYFRFNDGYLVIDDKMSDTDSVSFNILCNGLAILPLQNYSITEIDNKQMWIEMLDLFGGRTRADGLDSFANLMMDPLTKEVCETYMLPTDYIEALGYANSLLSTNKYNRHTDITGNRFRTNERLVHFLYKSLATSYGNYLREVKNNKKDASFTMKQSAVIDLTLADVTTSDLSKLNPLLELEMANTVTFKGLSGMNSDRSYSLDKRTYDDTMVNKLSMSTGFSNTVGINRQATINMGIESTKGYIKYGNELDKMNDVNTLSITEALTPFGVTRDDPFRTAMTFIQTAKHGMRTNHQDPLLVTNGADQALPYITSDTFAHKAKDFGIIKEVTDDYAIVEYRPHGANNSKDSYREFIDLRERVEKNSDGGFYITIKLDLNDNIKKGSTVEKGDIIAYDKSSYSNSVGNGKQLAYNIGTLTKVAVMHTDEGFEDSAVISEDLAKKMGSEIVLQVDVLLDAKDIILNSIQPGVPVQEGDSLMIYQSSFEDEDATKIIEKLVDKNDKDSVEMINDLGKIKVKSKVTGILQDIKVYRTVELNDMSNSLKRFVNSIESKAKSLKDTIKKNGIPNMNSSIEPTEVLPPIGKLKHAEGKVLVEYYIKYFDNMSVGDKLVYFSALKGVVKNIFPGGQEPYSEFRPKETVHSFLPVGSVNGRMVGSVLVHGAINKVLIELDRKVKDIMEIPYEENL